MNPIFQFPTYLLKRQALALTGKFRIYDPAGRLVLFSEQKMFKLREDIRVFSDESKTQEVLSIKARQILDFSAAYDVVDSAYNQKVGALRRRGLQSILRDEWEVLDANDNVVGKLFEDSMGLALLRRFLLGSWLPQNYDMTFGETRVYIAGDSEDTPEMKALTRIDIAFLPMNLPYTMTPEMVASGAKGFKPKVLYPYHTGESDINKLLALLKDTPEIEVRVRKMK